jgi:hypothetical protein
LKKGLGLIFVFLIAASSAPAINLRIKVAGGLGYFNLKDINRALKSWEEFMKEEAATVPGWSFQSGTVPRFQTGAELEGELLLSLSRRLAFGLGSGYLYGELRPEKTELSILRGAYTYIYTKPVKVSAQPLMLSGYYFLPLGKKFSVFFRAGGGYLWAKYVGREGYRRLPTANFSYTSSQIARGHGTIFQAGIGLKYELEPAVSLFFEASGRRAKASGFEGDEGSGSTGKLYFYEEYSPVFKLWQAKVQLWGSAPAGEYFRSVREASFDFNGFSLKMGILILF